MVQSMSMIMFMEDTYMELIEMPRSLENIETNIAATDRTFAIF